MRLAGRVRHALSDLPAEQHAALRLRQGATRESASSRERTPPRPRGIPPTTLPRSAAATTGRPSPRFPNIRATTDFWRGRATRPFEALLAQGGAARRLRASLPWRRRRWVSCTFGADPNYEQNMKAINNEYSVEGLPVKLDWVKTAVAECLVDKYPLRLDRRRSSPAAYWWAGKMSRVNGGRRRSLEMGDKSSRGSSTSTRRTWPRSSSFSIRRWRRAGGRSCSSGDSGAPQPRLRGGHRRVQLHQGHGQGYEGGVPQHGHHFYDWRDSPTRRRRSRIQVMVDKLHQGSESNYADARVGEGGPRLSAGKKFFFVSSMKRTRSSPTWRRSARRSKSRRSRR